MAESICSIDGCDSPHDARGWCGMHYMNWRRNGDPEAPSKKAKLGENLRWLRERFDADDSDECFPLRDRVGRAVLEIDTVSVYAYRIVCEWQNGSAPEDTEASHLCGNGHLGCVNRRHLIWGTTSQNQRRRAEHGTDNGGERNGHAKLSEADVLAIRADNRLYRVIAADYGVHSTTVGGIKRRETWAHL